MRLPFSWPLLSRGVAGTTCPHGRAATRGQPSSHRRRWHDNVSKWAWPSRSDLHLVAMRRAHAMRRAGSSLSSLRDREDKLSRPPRDNDARESYQSHHNDRDVCSADGHHDHHPPYLEPHAGQTHGWGLKGQVSTLVDNPGIGFPRLPGLLQRDVRRSEAKDGGWAARTANQLSWTTPSCRAIGQAAHRRPPER